MIEKINILYIIDTLEKVGGTERHLLYLVKNLDRERFNCLVCTLNDKEGSTVKEMREHNINVKIIPVKRIYGFNALKQVFKLVKIIKENKIDIIQTFHFKSDVYGGLVAIFLRKPIFISSRRDVGYLKTKPKLLVSYLLNKFFDRFIAVSDSVKESISKNEGVAHSKIITIYNGVDLGHFYINNKFQREEIRKKLNIDSDALVIGTVVNFRTDKGYDIFFRSIAQVMRFRKDALVLVVRDGPLYGYFKDFVRDIGISSKIIFTGYRKDIPKILSSMDIFCISSKSEGFSNVVLEAFACGKPIIATKVGGNKEAVVEQETGILVPPDDSGKMAAAILKLCEDAALREKMGLAGRKRIESVFTLERMIKQMEELYLGLTNNGRRYRW
jgi:glycosyltransferase involved in cell wall biosynthesis